MNLDDLTPEEMMRAAALLAQVYELWQKGRMDFGEMCVWAKDVAEWERDTVSRKRREAITEASGLPNPVDGMRVMIEFLESEGFFNA